MHIADWLTLAASLVALLSVILSYRSNKRQLEATATLAIKQIEAAAQETSRKLRADILLKDKQGWIREFRETINEILYLGDPDSDDTGLSTEERLRSLTRLGHKVDLLLPVGEAHANLITAIIEFVQFLKPVYAGTDRQRLDQAAKIIVLARRILHDELQKVEAGL